MKIRLTRESASKLAQAAMSVRPVEIGCGDCAAQLEILAERILRAQDVPEALRLVENHLKTCPECKEEFEALLAALRELQRTGQD